MNSSMTSSKFQWTNADISVRYFTINVQHGNTTSTRTAEPRLFIYSLSHASSNAPLNIHIKIFIKQPNGFQYTWVREENRAMKNGDYEEVLMICKDYNKFLS